MATAFRDLVLRLTEAALVADAMTAEEIAALFVEAGQVIENLRDKVTELGEPRHGLNEAVLGDAPKLRSRE